MARRRLGAFGLAALLALALLAVWKLGLDRPGAETAAPAGPRAAPAPQRGTTPADMAAVALGAIEGTVRDPAGAPIAAAEVCASAIPAPLGVVDDELRDPVCGAAGTDGRYRLSELLPARYSVEAAARHFYPGRHQAGMETSIQLAAGEVRRGVDIVLYPGGVELAGIVKDIGGGPVAGAWVLAVPAGSSVAARTRSRADGTFRLWVARGAYHLIAGADGYADADRRSAAPGPTAELFLTPESSLAGRVVQAGTGAAVAGARVSTWLDPDGQETLVSTSATTLTDAQGRFRFTRLEPGRYKPGATSVSGFGHARESILLGLGQSADDVLIEVHPALSVRGRVVVSGDETPCPSGSVSLHDHKADRFRRGAVDPDGRVVFEGLAPGRYEVDVLCDRFFLDEEIDDVVLAAGAPLAEQIWKVRAGATIRGEVRSSGGEPVAHAWITASMREGGRNQFADAGNAHSEPDGTFELGGLRAGTYVLLVAAPDQPGLDEPVVVTVGERGVANADIRLGAGGDVTGDVVDEHGQPLAGVDVRIQATQAPLLRTGGSGDALTADDGSFSLHGLPAGAYQVTAIRDRRWGSPLREPGKRGAAEPGEKVDVVPGRTARVHLVVESMSAVIRGRVLDERARAVTDAFIDAELDSGGPGRARHSLRWHRLRGPVLTDGDGSFTIEGLSAGTYTLRAYRRGGGEALAEQVATGASVTLTIQPTGSIAGAIESEGSAVPTEFSIRVRDRETDFSRSETFFRTAGRFALRDLPSGSFVVLVTASEGTSTSQVELAEGQNLSGLVIKLAGRTRVVGRIVARDDGKPLPGFEVNVAPLEPDGSSSFSSSYGRKGPLVTGADGRFALDDVPSGRVQIFASRSGSLDSRYRMARKSAELTAGTTNDVGDVAAPPMSP